MSGEITRAEAEEKSTASLPPLSISSATDIDLGTNSNSKSRFCV